MITVQKQTIISGTNKFDYKLKGLSTDEKPSKINGVNIGENSLFLEMDTGDFYYLKQQGSSSTERKEVLEETTFSNWEHDNNYYYVYDDAPQNDATYTMTFVWDGTEYILSVDETGRFGATFDLGNETYDFSEYPFSVIIEIDGIEIASQDNESHTLEIYYDETTVIEPIWAKVGGGGNSTELPKVTVSITPDQSITVYNNVGCVYNFDIEAYVYYDKDGNTIDIDDWDDIVSISKNETETVVFYANEVDISEETIWLTDVVGCLNLGSYLFEGMTGSSKENCEVEESYIVVIDQTQNASASLFVHLSSLG